MDVEWLKSVCLAYPFVTEEYPFDLDTAVFKVKGKMFALFSLESDPLSINLKCDPQDAIALRAQYEAIIPGYHMDKRHWNTLRLDGSLPETLVRELLDHSYALVVGKLRVKDREAVLRAWQRQQAD